MKAAAKATYGRKGDDVVAKNWAAIDEGAKQVVEICVIMLFTLGSCKFMQMRN